MQMIGVKFVTFSVDQNSALDTGCFEVAQFFDGLDENAEILKRFHLNIPVQVTLFTVQKKFNKNIGTLFPSCNIYVYCD